MTRHATLAAQAAAAPPVKSADRVLAIFEYFARVRGPRTLSEIAQDLRYPVSSALALLRSVQGMGYLDFDPKSKCYLPSIRFAMLSQWIYDREPISPSVKNLMQQLAAATHETTLLSMETGLRLQHIDIVHTQQALSYHPPVGTLRPLLRSAGGRVLLAERSDESIVQTVERINTLGLDDGRIFDPVAVLADIATVRTQGFAYAANLFEPGAAIISMALPATASRTPMAISLGGPASRITLAAVPGLRDQIVAALVELL